MIRKIHVPALDLAIPLGAFNVIVGVNGCGKTATISAMQALHGGTPAFYDHHSCDDTDALAILATVLPGARVHGATVAWGAFNAYAEIATVRNAAREGRVATLDPIANGLHPSAAGRLVAALRTIGAQVIAATHSPDVVDAFTGDEVIVLHEGKAALLSQHPEWAKWSTICRTGEFWSTVGESWVADVKVAEQPIPAP